MNKTEVIVETVKRILDQGTVSINSEGTCLYRGQNGTKCAIGVWIPDEKYDMKFDDTHVTTSILDRLDILEVLPDYVAAIDIADLSYMQSWHDSMHVDSSFEYVYSMARSILTKFDAFALFEEKHGSLKEYVNNHWKPVEWVDND